MQWVFSVVRQLRAALRTASSVWLETVLVPRAADRPAGPVGDAGRRDPPEAGQRAERSEADSPARPAVGASEPGRRAA